MSLISHAGFVDVKSTRKRKQLCESRGGRPGFPSLIVRRVCVDVKQRFAVLLFLLFFCFCFLCLCFVVVVVPLFLFILLVFCCCVLIFVVWVCFATCIS